VRQEQGPRGVAVAQQHHAAVELRDLLRKLRGVAAAQRLRDAPGLHAHAARFVDGRGAAFQLPAGPQRKADGGEGDQQQRAADQAEFGREGTKPAH
jgi:hypothetical protein